MTAINASIDTRYRQVAWRNALWTSAVVVLLSRAIPFGLVRALIVLPIVTFVPGWPLLRAVFGRDEEFDTTSTLVFAIALGICADIACGLVLGTIGAGFGSLSWLVAIAAFTWGATRVARGRGADLSLRVPIARSLRFPAAVVIGVLIAATGTSIAIATLARPSGTPYTEFSFADATATRAQPLQLSEGSSLTLPVAIRRVGDEPTDFRLVASVDGNQVTDEAVSVPGSAWSGAVQLRMPGGQCLHRVVLQLQTPTRIDAAHELVTYVQGTGAACHS